MSSEENTTPFNLSMSFLFALVGVAILMVFEIDIIAQLESIDLPILALFGVLVVIGWFFGGWLVANPQPPSNLLKQHKKKHARKKYLWQR